MINESNDIQQIIDYLIQHQQEIEKTVERYAEIDPAIEPILEHIRGQHADLLERIRTSTDPEGTIMRIYPDLITQSTFRRHNMGLRA